MFHKLPSEKTKLPFFFNFAQNVFFWNKNKIILQAPPKKKRNKNFVIISITFAKIISSVKTKQKNFETDYNSDQATTNLNQN